MLFKTSSWVYYNIAILFYEFNFSGTSNIQLKNSEEPLKSI